MSLEKTEVEAGYSLAEGIFLGAPMTIQDREEGFLKQKQAEGRTMRVFLCQNLTEFR